MAVKEHSLGTKLVWWPSPQDYNEAVQNPDVNFSLKKLQESSIFVGSLGLPRPVCGAFASVYRVRTDDSTEFAVRCFLRNISDQEARYAMISEFVQNDSLPYTVGFEFAPQGIKIRNDWFPVLKMDWVAGHTLEQFVIANLGDSNCLSNLARKFLVMCDELREAGIAHGDLQHGNILVTDGGELRLVDYDGMYVPAMSGMAANELGHRNYQHPGRTATTFGPYLDYFSAWVIYASLKIVSIDSSLLARLRGGDECLLFSRDDFQNPTKSWRFSILENHSNEEIRRLAQIVRANIGTAIQQVPPLTEVLPPVEVAPLPAESNNVKVPDPTDATLPDWLNAELSANGKFPDWMVQEPGRFVRSTSIQQPPIYEEELRQAVPRNTEPPIDKFLLDPVLSYLIGCACVVFFLRDSTDVLPYFLLGMILLPLALLSEFSTYKRLKQECEVIRNGVAVPGEIIDIDAVSYTFAFRSLSGERFVHRRSDGVILKFWSTKLDKLRNGPTTVTVVYGANPAEDALVYSVSDVKAVFR